MAKKLYLPTIEKAINLEAHIKTQDDFENKNISLKEYLEAFYRNWNIINNENS